MKKILVLIPILFSVCVMGETDAPPLVDGDCQEYPGLKAQQEELSKDVRLYLYQDEHYVWICYSYPEGSFGTMDLKLSTKKLSEPMNLHVSAQLGQWPADKPDLEPKNPESDLWWNAKGWTANPVWINGMDQSATPPRYKFKNAKAREVQLSKSEFGTGDWRFSLEIRAIKGSDGNFYDITFPKTGPSFVYKVSE